LFSDALTQAEEALSSANETMTRILELKARSEQLSESIEVYRQNLNQSNGLIAAFESKIVDTKQTTENVQKVVLL
jgi:uncharacterized coiled-coil DUF342 family protein